MKFSLEFARTDAESLSLEIEPGEILFVLGANGTGKSGLIQKFFASNFEHARRISAHRQIWFSSSSQELSPLERNRVEQNYRNNDREAEARFREEYAAQRSSVALYDLLDAENILAQKIAGAVRTDQIDLAKELGSKDAPINVINDLLRLSNIPIEILVEGSGQISVSKGGSAPYAVAELSDGERSALIVAATILTAAPGSLLLIDEPERHLHRSIISPLLSGLLRRRQDCAFVVSTHDLLLPLDNPGSRTLLVRSCVFEGKLIRSWDADLLPSDTEIDDALKEDILGARRKIIFVEGAKQSLDYPLYSLIFPMISVVPKGSSRDVRNAVSGIQAAASLSWLQAWGIIDNDGRTALEVARLRTKSVFALPCFSVESVYYHPSIIKLIPGRAGPLTKGAATARLRRVARDALDAVSDGEIASLSARVAEKAVRERMFRRLPTSKSIRAGTAIKVEIDVKSIVAAEVRRLKRAIRGGDLLTFTTRYPIRESQAPRVIARRLGFTSKVLYEKAVLDLLMADPEALSIVRALFGELPGEV